MDKWFNSNKVKVMEKEKTHSVIDTSIGCSPDEYYRFYGTLEECQAYIKEHENEPNLGIIPMIHFAQNNYIIIGVDFGYGNDIAVKTTAKVHEDGRLEILKSERIGRTRDIKQEHRDRIIEELKQFGKEI